MSRTNPSLVASDTAAISPPDPYRSSSTHDRESPVRSWQEKAQDFQTLESRSPPTRFRNIPLMRALRLLLLTFVLPGCATRPPAQWEASSFFPLRMIEGRVDEPGSITLPAFPGKAAPRISLLATAPEDFQGVSVWFRFKSGRDPDYRWLRASRGRRFRVTARDGEGLRTGDAIVFVSTRGARFELLADAGPDGGAAVGRSARTCPVSRRVEVPSPQCFQSSPGMIRFMNSSNNGTVNAVSP